MVSLVYVFFMNFLVFLLFFVFMGGGFRLVYLFGELLRSPNSTGRLSKICQRPRDEVDYVQGVFFAPLFLAS